MNATLSLVSTEDPAPSALDRLLRPRSIVIVGASPQFAKVNGRPLKHLIDKGYTGRIFLVNPKYREIAGIACYPNVAALPESADLAIVALPAREVEACIAALGQRGIVAAVIFSSGFGELGAEGKRLEQSLSACADAHGVLICGPNCLGFVNAFDGVYATFSQYADGDTGAGPVAFVTQSGAFGTAIAALVRQRGLGLGYFINTGNEAGVSFSDLMLAVIEDPRIRVAAGYLEGMRDGPGLIRLAERCTELGKPLVLTKVGRMAAGVRAAASHTGSLAVEDDVFDAVLRQNGVLRARNEEQMLDMLEALCSDRVPEGCGLGIATQSGGAGVMMADRAEELGLEVPALAPQTQAALAKVMPAFGAAGNPVDVTGQFIANPDLLLESVVKLLADPQVHIGIVWLQLMTAHVDLLVNIFCRIRERTDKPFFICWVAAPPEAVRRLRAEGIVVFGAGERAIEAAAALVQYRRTLRVAAERRAERAALAAAVQRATSEVCASFRDGVQPTVQATAWLQAAGVPMAPVALACQGDEAVAAWRELGGQVVLKIESPDITHKTELGGVLLKLNDEVSIRQGFTTLMQRAGAARPDARLDGVIVQSMAAGHLELVIGVKRDPAFGMVLMVGLGGVLVEVLKDVAFRLAPISEAEGLRMLDELRMRALLDGVRGQQAVDRAALAALLSRLSVWAAAMAPRLEELDLNPVLVGPDGPLGVDCVMVFSRVEAS
ncbi:acetate--CoA ligase family protein [Burkholderia sp. R-70006]|uniref:acetate--CoA ligase family protein n=1 Tax=Paraburkholderia domus TaxID=2793075 RepID=UPI0019144B42|nr:acetate--CoA ligase family protein [Paraburkholderia domus]MBK5050463.1 acetate--CoA ligase family protein [Burkholderia sp. R-70006]